MSKIDHEVTDEIVCPYCGYAFSDSYEYHNSELILCHKCNKNFGLSVSHSIAYTTSKIPCANGEGEHKWGYWHSYGMKRQVRCCRGCDKHEYREVEEK